MASDDLTLERAREMLAADGQEVTDFTDAILAAWERDRDRLATVTAQRDALVTLVDGAQWYCAASNSSESCPWCGAMKHWGHEQDCEARTALTAIRAERATTTEPTDAK